MKALNALEIPLTGRNLIQASAGTGKTWTLSLLYLRLLLEQQLTVDQLLVVTYTRAATDELRERIRTRLKTAVQLYEKVLYGEKPADMKKTVKGADPEYRQLLGSYPPTDKLLWYLQRALLSFDEAAVFTIHGFCQRALQEHAFEVGLPFETELVSDESELLRQLADQFWQQHLTAPNALNQAVLEHFLPRSTFTPDTLLTDVKAFIGRPYLKPVCDAPVSEQAFLQQQQAMQQTLAQAGQLWEAQQDAVMALLASDAMKNTSYGPGQQHKMRAAMQALLAQGQVHGLEKDLSRFTPESIEKGTKVRQPSPQHAFFPLMQTLLEQAAQQDTLRQTALEQLRHALLEWLRTELPQRKQQSGQLAYDDLLVQLEQALISRPSLAEALSRRYRVALIDEFQDTDPIQYHIFDTIYRDQGQVFYVGDPKQAIY
ncbi:MAG: UvrD-helicase domain-containing protein, partial [Thiothrix sp.]|nr:UvrD-helicase domain-containing protein [Thiothrix sp.]